MRSKGTLPILLGLLMIVSALGLSAYNVYDARHAEEAALETVAYIREARPIPKSTFTPELMQHLDEEVEIPDYILNPKMEMPVMHHDGWDYIATITIPSLELEIPVISKWSYPALRVAPCRYTGSAYLDNLVIAGHNYASHFGRLNELSEGEQVLLTDSDGNTFTYQVKSREILQPTAIEEMVEGDWDLTLFTCTVGGKARVTVRCDKVTDY